MYGHYSTVQLKGWVQESPLVYRPFSVFDMFSRLGMFGAVVDYGCERRVSEHSSLGATMSIGPIVGVTLKIKWVET